MQNIRLAKILFFLAAMMDVLGIVAEEPLLHYVFKPLIIPTLWLYYKLQVRKPNYFYGIALFCSFFGDVALLFEGLNLFMLGLVCFLIAHFFFIVIIRKRIRHFSLNRFLKRSIPFMALVIALISLLETKGLESLFFPITLYGCVIALFGTFALYSYLELKNSMTKFMFLGALLFILSDSILAVNAFYKPSHLLNVFVMVTYISAQYFIVKSMLEKKKSGPKS